MEITHIPEILTGKPDGYPVEITAREIDKRFRRILGEFETPWRADAKVEQDLIISRGIVEIFSHPLLAGHLAFRGGTALHKIFLLPSARYSEDIDLVQVAGGPIGPIFDALRDKLSSWLGKPQRKQGPGVVNLTYKRNRGVAFLPWTADESNNTREEEEES